MAGVSDFAGMTEGGREGPIERKRKKGEEQKLFPLYNYRYADSLLSQTFALAGDREVRSQRATDASGAASRRRRQTRCRDDRSQVALRQTASRLTVAVADEGEAVTVLEVANRDHVTLEASRSRRHEVT